MKLETESPIIAQLRAQKLSPREAKKIANEIFANQKFRFKEKKVPKTVGEYYKKYLTKKKTT